MHSMSYNLRLQPEPLRIRGLHLHGLLCRMLLHPTGTVTSMALFNFLCPLSGGRIIPARPINPTLKMQLPLPVGIRLSAGFVALRRGLRVSQSYLFMERSPGSTVSMLSHSHSVMGISPHPS